MGWLKRAAPAHGSNEHKKTVQHAKRGAEHQEQAPIFLPRAKSLVLRRTKYLDPEEGGEYAGFMPRQFERNTGAVDATPPQAFDRTVPRLGEELRQSAFPAEQSRGGRLSTFEQPRKVQLPRKGFSAVLRDVGSGLSLRRAPSGRRREVSRLPLATERRDPGAAHEPQVSLDIASHADAQRCIDVSQACSTCTAPSHLSSTSLSHSVRSQGNFSLMSSASLQNVKARAELSLTDLLEALEGASTFAEFMDEDDETKIYRDRSSCSATETGRQGLDTSPWFSNFGDALDTAELAGLHDGAESCVESVVRLLGGLSCSIGDEPQSLVSRRRAPTGHVWLQTDLKRLAHRVGGGSTVYDVTLNTVRRLRLQNCRVHLHGADGSYLFFDFTGRREDAETLFRALAMLLPFEAELVGGFMRLPSRARYNPLADLWRRAPVADYPLVGNEYTCLQKLGRGSCGRVELALSRSSRKFCTVKILDDWRHGPQCTRVKSLWEVLVMCKVRHPNLVQLEGVVKDCKKKAMYLLMEYVPGGVIMSSSRLKSDICMPEKKAKRVARDLLHVLVYLHENGIVHGDIKPDNILVGQDSTYKLSDFGSAALLGQGRNSFTTRATVGTPAFAPPELCFSRESPTTSTAQRFLSDVWSLGVTLFYLVYGQTPFFAKNMFEMYQNIATKDVVFPTKEGVSAEFVQLLRSMLTRNVAFRPTASELLASRYFC